MDAHGHLDISKGFALSSDDTPTKPDDGSTPRTPTPSRTRRWTKKPGPEHDSPERNRPSLDATRLGLPSPRNSSQRNLSGGRKSFTPEQYVGSINAHSLRLLTSSSFPGNNYVDLANWLLHDTTNFQQSPDQSQHVLAVMYDLGSQGKAPQCFTQDNLEAFKLLPQPTRDQPQLLFLRGFLSPSWLSVVGSKYMIDPEFLLRHLDFFAGSVHRHVYSLPSLASTSSNIIRLCVSTLVHRDAHSTAHHPDDLLTSRRELRDKVWTYRRQLRTQARCGDSLVREYSTVDDHHSVIEQWISLCVVKRGEGWLGLVWMDQGKDLMNSPSGPWNADILANGSAFPVVQHHPKMTVRNTVNITPEMPSKNPKPSLPKRPHSDSGLAFPQTGSLLPLEYESLLALVDLGRRCNTEPVLALIPVFAHAAFSEVHFLNLVEGQIACEVDSLADDASNGSLQNLQYLSSMLERHTANLKTSLRAISILFDPSGIQANGKRMWRENRSPRLAPEDGDDWGPSSSSASLASGTFTVQGLNEDYQELLIRSLKLADRCTLGIQTMMNKAMVLESHKAIQQAERLKKLTLLASFFIPLSFVASVFGMNFNEIGQGPLPLWWFFVLSIPVTVGSQLYYIWDSRKMSKWWKVLWQKRLMPE